MSTTPIKKIKVLIVDDSPAVAEFLTHLLNMDARVEVVGVACDGKEAINMAQTIRPDVITMDIHMPKVNGFEATRKIMETCPAPIVIVSGALSPNEIATNFRAIEAGALAVVARPQVGNTPDNCAVAKELLDTVKLMSEVKVVRRWATGKFLSLTPVPARVELNKLQGPIQIVAIGASTGGPLVLQTILAGLPVNFPLPILIVQHMTPGFVAGFVEWLAQASRFAIHVAVDGELLLPGHAYVAPDYFHLGVQEGPRVLLTPDTNKRTICPSVSALFSSVERLFGAKAVGILLTGMGQDGAQELRTLKAAGAVTIVQDEKSSVVHGMPGKAIEIGAANYILPPEAIVETLISMTSRL